MKKIYLLNTATFPTPGTHYHTTNKFCSGFNYFDYETIEIKNDSDIFSLEDSSDTIIMISNHGISNRNYDGHSLNIFERFKNAKFILWFFHFLYEKHNNSIPYIKNYIITGSHFRNEPKSPEAIPYWNIQKIIGEKYLSLSFSSYFPIEKIGTYERNEKYDAQFVGYGYKRDWCSNLPNILYKDTGDWKNQISEDERINSFLQSYCALGFHSEYNKIDSCIVERVFEGLALGCVVLSDNKAAYEETNGIVEYIETKEQMIEKIEYFKNNPDIRKQKQLLGYEYIKNIGSYKHQAEKFLNKFQEVYGN